MSLGGFNPLSAGGHFTGAGACGYKLAQVYLFHLELRNGQGQFRALQRHTVRVTICLYISLCLHRRRQVSLGQLHRSFRLLA